MHLFHDRTSYNVITSLINTMPVNPKLPGTLHDPPPCPKSKAITVQQLLQDCVTYQLDSNISHQLTWVDLVRTIHSLGHANLIPCSTDQPDQP